MGRRALPKIDPDVCVAEHLHDVADLQQPFDPQSLFPTRQPLELEIGSGKGHFVLRSAMRNPARNYLGNEISRKYAHFGAYRLVTNDVSNGRMLSGNGLVFFKDLLPDDCAQDVHVYFPDPWWKGRHRRRRIMQPDFIADIQRVLVAGGRLHFWTDVQQYFETTIELLAKCSEFSAPQTIEPNEPQDHMDYQTHFERRMRMHGHDIYRAKFFMPS